MIPRRGHAANSVAGDVLAASIARYQVPAPRPPTPPHSRWPPIPHVPILSCEMNEIHQFGLFGLMGATRPVEGKKTNNPNWFGYSLGLKSPVGPGFKMRGNGVFSPSTPPPAPPALNVTLRTAKRKIHHSKKISLMASADQRCRPNFFAQFMIRVASSRKPPRQTFMQPVTSFYKLRMERRIPCAPDGCPECVPPSLRPPPRSAPFGPHGCPAGRSASPRPLATADRG